MAKIIKTLSVFLLCLWIAGCAVNPQKIGISPEKWNSYSDSHKQLLTDRYKQTQAARTQLIEQATDESQQQAVMVNIQGGRVMMAPFRRAYSYQPFSFNIKSNECKDIMFKQIDGAKTTEVAVCYLKKTLYIDPDFTDKAKALGSIRLVYMPLWTRGFTYNGISSTGTARLTNVDIHVQTQ